METVQTLADEDGAGDRDWPHWIVEIGACALCDKSRCDVDKFFEAVVGID